MPRNLVWTAQNAAQKIASAAWSQPYGAIVFAGTKATTYDAWGSFSGVSKGALTDVTVDVTAGNVYAVRVSGAGSVTMFDPQGYLLDNEPRVNSSNVVTGWMLRPETSGTYRIEIFGDFVFGLGVEADLNGDGKNAAGGITNSLDTVPLGVARFGTAAAERLTGTAFGDTLNGDAGNDTLVSGGGNDSFIGGDGHDVVILTGKHTEVTRMTVTPTEAFSGSMRGDLVMASGQTALLDGIEAVRFDDGQFVFDVGLGSKGNADIAYRLYRAALGRLPDEGGLAVQVVALDAGTSPLQLAQNFAGSAEFRAKFGAPDNAAYATLLYTNVLGRAPDAAGLAVQIQALSGGLSRDQLLLNFSESAENRTNTAADTAHGYFLL